MNGWKRGDYRVEYDIYKEMYNIEMEILQHLKQTLGKNLKEAGGEYRVFEASCMRNIEEYTRKNRKLTNSQFKKLDKEIKKSIKAAYKAGAESEEFEILKEIKNGFVPPVQGIALGADFYKLNRARMDALRDEALLISSNCKTAILRTTDDIYRKIVFECATYSNLGFNLWESVDRAVNKFTAAGITGITFANGANWNVASYAEMALRTSMLRSKNFGEGSMRENWGVGYVQVSSYGACSKICLPWQGKVYWDDVYTALPIPENCPYQLLSIAIAAGLFHPNCRHNLTTFFPGISEPPRKWKSDAETTEHSEAEAKQRYYERKIRENDRQAKMAFTQKSQIKYKNRAKEYKMKLSKYIKDTNNTAGKVVLRHDREREKFR